MLMSLTLPLLAEIKLHDRGTLKYDIYEARRFELGPGPLFLTYDIRSFGGNVSIAILEDEIDLFACVLYGGCVLNPDLRVISTAHSILTPRVLSFGYKGINLWVISRADGVEINYDIVAFPSYHLWLWPSVILILSIIGYCYHVLLMHEHKE